VKQYLLKANLGRHIRRYAAAGGRPRIEPRHRRGEPKVDIDIDIDIDR